MFGLFKGLFSKGRSGAAPWAFADAVCYSGYREGQDPNAGLYPSYEEIREDLRILARNWRYLRVYDSGPHAETVLRVIRREKLDFKVMLGLALGAEVSNPNCPWGGVYPEPVLAANRKTNDQEIRRAIALAKRYRKQVFSVSIGNEASVEWNDHMVPVERLIAIAKTLQSKIPHPVTFCENYAPWADKLKPLAEVLDFISIHTYPVWEYRSIDEALDYTRQNYASVKQHYPDKPVIITEAGWTTAANGRGIEPWNASEELHAAYYEQLMAWVREEKILTFVFEAFDEPWKGSPDPLEPEKHWGLFKVDRTPKQVMKALYPDL